MRTEGVILDGRSVLERSTLERAIADPADRAIFQDEAVPLELEGRGSAGVLPGLLQSGKELFITVRTDCLMAFSVHLPFRTVR